MRVRQFMAAAAKPCATAMLIFSMSALYAQSLSDYKDTFQVVAQEKGVHCNNPNSLFLKLKNNGSVPMDLLYAYQQLNGEWETGEIKNIAPGSNTGDQIMICQTNGRYKWWARPVSMSNTLKFPGKERLNK